MRTRDWYNSFVGRGPYGDGNWSSEGMACSISRRRVLMLLFSLGAVKPIASLDQHISNTDSIVIINGWVLRADDVALVRSHVD